MKRALIVSVVLALLGAAAYATPPTSGGPGGIGNTNGTSTLVMWLKASSITGLLNGAVITNVNWPDGSGYGNHAYTAPVPPGTGKWGGNPFYFSSSNLNGGPLVRFTAVGQTLYTTMSNIYLPSNHTMFACAKDNTTNTDNGMFLWFMNPGPSVSTVGDEPAGPAFGSGGNGVYFRVRNYAYNNVSMPTNQWQVWTVSASNRVTGLLDSVVKLDFGMNSWPGYFSASVTNGMFLLGSHGGGVGQYLNGDISEAIVFTNTLNDAQRIIVENYLSSGYLTSSLGANDFYSGDTTAKGDYDRDAFGIGRVNAANQVTNGGAAGFGIESSDGSLGDGEWVFAGHKVQFNSRAAIDLPAGISQRWARVWYVEKTGSINATLAFDFSDGGLAALGGSPTFSLLYSTANAFSFSTVPVSGTLNGDTVTFPVPDGNLASGYYTLGSTEPVSPASWVTVITDGGPGGIGTTNGTLPLKVWYKADAVKGKLNGQFITKHVPDSSGSGNNSTTIPIEGQDASTLDTPGSAPTFITNATDRGGPVLRFGGSNTIYTATSNLYLPASHTMMIALRDRGTTDGYWMWFTTQGANYNVGNLQDGPGVGQFYPGFNSWIIREFSLPGIAYFNNDANTNRWQVFTVIRNGAATIDGYAGGVNPGVVISSTWTGTFASGATMGQLQMGRHYNAIPQYFLGDMAEVLLYATNLNAAERVIAENYLNARHMTNALNANDFYSGDSAAKGGYSLDVFGIGSLSASVQVTNSGSAGFGIAAVNGSLAASDWIFAGHRVPIAFRVTNDVPAGLVQRWNRVWYVEKTGNEDVQMAFDHSNAGLTAPVGSPTFRLLYSSTQSPYSFTDLGLAPNVSGDTVTFALLSSQFSSGYYTLASDEAVAAPSYTVITGGRGPGGIGTTNGTSPLLVWLKADAITGLNVNDPVTTQWKDGSGYGNNSRPYPGTTAGGSAGGDPTYTNNATPNNGPAVYFDGADDLYTATTNLTLPHQHTIFAVARDFPVSDGMIVWFQHAGANLESTGDDVQGPTLQRYYNGNSYIMPRNYADWPNPWYFRVVPVPSNSWLIFTVKAMPTFVEGYVNGREKPLNYLTNAWSGSFGPGSNKAAFLLGEHAQGVGQYFKGYMAEIICFGTNLNAAEQVVVQNYLSAKLMTNALDDGDFYAGDTPAKGDYDLDVFGIGRVNDQDQLTAGGNAGFGITAINNAMDNSEWVLAGHKVASNSLVSTEGISGDLRWNRVWYVDVTGQVDARLSFNFADGGLPSKGNGYVLLYSAVNAYSWTPIASGVAVGGTVSFDVPAASLQDGYYTLDVKPRGSLFWIR